jgi:ATP-dependent Clp protease ATP-binding subunit ClpC
LISLLAHGRTLGAKGEVMSRKLPLHANIEHLRKQAKERLRELQKTDPQAKLTDAQHAIALEYGFASWPTLRAHVESLGAQLVTAPGVAPPPFGGGGGVRVTVGANDAANHRFERFTPKAKQALFFSRHEAGQFGSITIEPEHVLLGMIRAGHSLKNRLFERAGVSLVGARAEVASRTAIREPLPSSIEIPFSDSTKQLLRAANEEADGLVHDNVGIAHLLLGLLGQPECVAATVLMGRGVDAQGVRRDIAALLNEETS